MPPRRRRHIRRPVKPPRDTRTVAERHYDDLVLKVYAAKDGDSEELVQYLDTVREFLVKSAQEFTEANDHRMATICHQLADLCVILMFIP